MTSKFLNLLICFITILQLAAAGISISALPVVSSRAIFGTYTAACACVGNLVVSSSPLGEQFKCASQGKPSATIFYAMPETRKSFEQIFKPLTQPYIGAYSFACCGGHALLDKEWSGPPGRSAPPVIYLLFFAIILALSNLPAPVFFFVRSE